MNLKFSNINENARLIFCASLRDTKKEVIPSGIKSFSSLDTFDKRVKTHLGRMASGISALASGASFAVAPKSIHINLSVDNNGTKEEIHVEHPREEFCVSTPIELGNYVNKEGVISLELEWTDRHRLSYFGIDTSNPKEDLKTIEVETIKPIGIEHCNNSQKSYDELLKEGIEIRPGEYANISFPENKFELNENETVSYLIKTKGWYKKISVEEIKGITTA